MFLEVAADSRLEVDDGFEDPASDAATGEGREEVLDDVEPRSGRWGEVGHLVGMPFQLGAGLWAPVGGVVIEDGMDYLAGCDFAIDGVQEGEPGVTKHLDGVG